MNKILLPSYAQWVYKEKGPCMLTEALRHYGTLEHPGKANNPNIMAWAKEVGVNGWYTNDDIPWCGLFVAVVTQRCKYPHPKRGLVLGARYWASYGIEIPFEQASFMDIMVYERPGGNHVAFNWGYNGHAYLNYGGNQSNRVGLAWINSERLIAVRRPPYAIGVPPNIRPIILKETGQLSQNEA